MSFDFCFGVCKNTWDIWLCIPPPLTSGNLFAKKWGKGSGSWERAEEVIIGLFRKTRTHTGNFLLTVPCPVWIKCYSAIAMPMIYFRNFVPNKTSKMFSYFYLPDRLSKIVLWFPWHTHHLLHVVEDFGNYMHHHKRHNFLNFVPIELKITKKIFWIFFIFLNRTQKDVEPAYPPQNSSLSL